MAILPSLPTILIAVANPRTGEFFEQNLRSCFDITILPDLAHIYSALHENIPVPASSSLLAEAPDHPVDLIIIEYGDDFAAAMELLGFLKNSHEYRLIPVVFISNGSDPEHERQALEQGAADFWNLPMEQTVLLPRIALQTHRSRKTRTLTRKSMMDDSTGVASRCMFENHLRVEWRRSVREGSWLSLSFIAMDGYETYAERLGLDSAEECMQILAGTLQLCLRRPGDMISRLSRDMFAALLPVTNTEGVPVVSQHMLHAVDGLELAFPGNVARLHLAKRVSISIGSASALPASPVGYERFADSAYAALGAAMAAGPGTMHQHVQNERADTQS